jgi:S1-C subfamily serine protease
VRWLLLCAVVATGVLVAAMVIGGARVAPPPAAKPPRVTRLTVAARETMRGTPVTLARDSLKRRAEQMTLRVRNISCAGVATGSGWPIDSHTLITNRHVLAGAAVLELNAWDGSSIEADVTQAQEGRLVDIGIATVTQELPAVAQTGDDPRPGDRVTAVGYPLGGKLTLSPGRVIRYLDGRTLGSGAAFDGQVLQLTTRVKHGNSGGPVLDRDGRVVAIIFAGEGFVTDDGYAKTALAIPLSSVRSLLSAGGTQAVLPCAQ